MQSFCFFGAPKEVGVRGLVPENNNNIKTNFDKVKNFWYIPKQLYFVKNKFIFLFGAVLDNLNLLKFKYETK